MQNILLFTGIGLVFGLLYNYLFYPHTFTEYLEAGSVSVLIGLGVGLLEEFALGRRLQALPFALAALLRTGLYALCTTVALCLVLSFDIAATEGISYADAVRSYLQSPLFRRDFLYTLFFVGLMLFLVEVILLIGKADFLRLLLGFYHKPREVQRLFMFVDLNNSTSLAERLDNKLFSALIQDYIADLSDAILLFRGEVYHYVGDEVIVVWPPRQFNDNCLRAFFKMQEVIERKKAVYFSRYGTVPNFKAAVHAGVVVVTQVGKLKKQIVYHGDVLNTTARIESKCNELHEQLLLSGDALQFIKPGPEFTVEEKAAISLRGKADKLNLYGVRMAEKVAVRVRVPVS